jgi:hypothetical protein
LAIDTGAVNAPRQNITGTMAAGWLVNSARQATDAAVPTWPMSIRRIVGARHAPLP